MSKTTIPPKVLQLLFGRAAGRCEYRGCNRLLTVDDLTKSTAKHSVFAHIVGDEPNGPRGDPLLSAVLAADIDNIMLLCFDCHRRIDVEDVPGHSVERLREMKRRHEERVRRLTEIDDSHRTLLVLMGANVGERKGVFDPVEVRGAALPMYAADDGVHIDLARLRVPDGDGISWAAGAREVEEAGRRVQDALARGVASHVSIFALAPIPLLMHLGRTIGDIVPGQAFQRRRDPPTWTWSEPTGDEPTFEVRQPEYPTASRDVALVLSVSDDVDVRAVRRVVPVGADVYVLAVAEPRPDIVRTRQQVADFGGHLRGLLPRLRTTHGGDMTLHVFPALPNSLAVQFGRILLPKSDPRIEVYDLNRAQGGWVHALTLLAGFDRA